VGASRLRVNKKKTMHIVGSSYIRTLSVLFIYVYCTYLLNYFLCKLRRNSINFKNYLFENLFFRRRISYFSSTVFQFYRISVLPYFGSTVFQFYRISVLPYFSSTVFQFYRISVLPYFSSTVFQFYRISVLPYSISLCNVADLPRHYTI